jgi:hypothetical protein
LGDHRGPVSIQQLETVALSPGKGPPGKSDGLCRSYFGGWSEEHQSRPSSSGDIAIPVSYHESDPDRQQNRRRKSQGHDAPADTSDYSRSLAGGTGRFQGPKQLELAVTGLASHYMIQHL